MMRYVMMMIVIGTISACSAKETKDYDASARCQALGHKPGTADYDKCVADEKTAKLLEEQRREYEEMKRQQDDWKMRRY